MTSFPDSRLRRLRGSEPIRNMARETRLSVKEFVYPVFHWLRFHCKAECRSKEDRRGHPAPQPGLRFHRLGLPRNARVP